jgi:thymidylate synthase
MYYESDTLDDLLLKVYPSLIAAPTVANTRGLSHELLGVSAFIRKPRARLCRSQTRGRAFSCLGELIWYLSKSNALASIAPYIPKYRKESEDGETVYGGYGPRLFGQNGHDQIANVLTLLRDSPTSRRAVIQLFDAADISIRRKEIPCTTTIQLFVRDNQLHLIASMRSNDAFIGLPHDVFCFTMLQEIIARSLGLEVGHYRHMAGSLHLYEDNVGDAKALIDERFQRRIEMPSMPNRDPWPEIDKLVQGESRVRAGEVFEATEVLADPYWADLLRLIQLFHTTDDEHFERLRNAVHFDGYRTYVRARAETRRRRVDAANTARSAV